MYKDESGWEPQLNVERLLKKREPNNMKDTNAVAVVRPREEAYQELSTQEHPNTINKKDEILGHFPLMSLFVRKFLKRGTNKGKTVVRGKRVNSRVKSRIRLRNALPVYFLW